MKFIKIAAGVALALAMVGCGRDSAPAAKTSAAKAYEPKALDGSEIAIQYSKNTSESLKAVVDTLPPVLKAMFGDNFIVSTIFSEDNVAAIKKFYTESGLEGADVRWALVTVGGISFAEIQGGGKIPEIAVAVAIDHDIDKVAAALIARLDEEQKKEFVETKVAGVKAWMKVWTDADESAKALGEGLCLASLDGKLLLVAPTSVMERLVALYKDGKGESAAFASLSSGGDAVLRVFAPALGTLVKKAADGGEADLSAVDTLIPNGSKILLGLGDVDLAVLANASGVSLRLAANTATDNDAAALKTMLNALVKSYVDGCKELTDEDSKFAYYALKDVKFGSEGKTFVGTMPIPADLFTKMLTVMPDINNARITACSSSVKTIRDAAVLYLMAKGKLPKSIDELIEEDSQGRSYLSEGSREDPWGNEYKLEASGKKIIVISAGPDGEFGTADDIRSDTKR